MSGTYTVEVVRPDGWRIGEPEPATTWWQARATLDAMRADVGAFGRITRDTPAHTKGLAGWRALVSYEYERTPRGWQPTGRVDGPVAYRLDAVPRPSTPSTPV